MKRPIAIAGISCLLTQLLAAFAPQAAIWLLAAFFVLLSFLLWRFRGKLWRETLVIAVTVCLALLLRGAYFALRIRPIQALADTEGTVTAVVLETNTGYAEDLANVVLQVTAYDGAKMPYRLGFKVQADGFPYTPPGETVRFAGRLCLPAQGKASDLRAAYEQGVFLAAEQVEQCEWLGPAQTMQAQALRLRKAVAKNICAYWPGDIAAVACAMSIGEKSLLRSEVREAFRSAGLSHALVVSGLHLSVVCGFAFSALHILLRRRYAALGAMAAAVLFAVVTGFTPSVVRSCVAMLLFYGAQACGRQSDALTSLGLAALVLCAINPYAASDIGLLLSFSATLGVLAAGAWTDARRQRRKGEQEENAACDETQGMQEQEEAKISYRAGAWAHRQGERLLEAFSVPVCTTLATLPVMAAAGMGVSLVGVFCNVLVLPLLGLIVPYGLILGCWNGNLLLEPVARISGLLCGVCVQLVLTVANWANNLPWALVTISGAAAVVTVLGSVALVFAGARRGVRIHRNLAVAALFVLLAGGMYAWFDRDVVRVAVVGSGTEPAVVITQQLHTAVVFRGGEGNVRAVERWLQKNNRDGIDVLIDLRKKGDAQELGQQLRADNIVQAQTLTYRVTTEAFCGILIMVGHQKNGNYAALDLGGFMVNLSVGKVDLSAYAAGDVYVAGASQPENLVCETLLLPPKLPAWVRENMPDVPVRTVESELCLLVRRGKSVQWKGATS